MAKLTLKAAPTFKAKVGVKVPGGEVANLELTFKHRTKTERDQWVKSMKDSGTQDPDFFMQMVEGWSLDEPFNRENVEVLLENYDGTAIETFRVYLEQLTQAKLGN